MHLWPRAESVHVCCSDVSLHVISFDRTMRFVHVDLSRTIEKKGRSYVRCIEARGLDEARRHGDPRRGIFQGQGGARQIRPDLPQDSGLLRLLHHREDHPRTGAGLPRICQEHREGSGRDSRTASPCSSCITCDGFSFTIKGETYFSIRASSTPTSINTPRMRSALFGTGLSTVFENLEGFPKDWKTNAAGIHQVRPRASVARASSNTANIPT